MSQPDPARTRFFILQAIRWSGVALVVIGLMIVQRRIDLPEEAGYALLLFGVIDTLFVPILLIRRWKSPPP